jgi:hypothetical protein
MNARAINHFGNAAFVSVGATPLNNEAELAAKDAFAKGATDKVLALRKGATENESLKQSKAKTFGDADEMQQNDPNAEISKEAVRFAIKNYKLSPDLLGKASYKNVAGLMKTAEDMKKFQETIASRMATQHENNEARKERLSTANSDRLNKRWSEFSNKSNAQSASSRSAFGKAANISRAAEALEGTVANYPDLNNLDSRQIAEIAKGLDSILSQGGSTVSGSEHLIPKSAQGKVASLHEYLSGLPKGAQQGAFVKRLLDTVQKEKEIANKQIEKISNRIGVGYEDLKKADPEHFNRVVIGDSGDDQSVESQSQSKVSSNSSSSSLQPGYIDDGHRFKGGDPNKKENWELVK